LTFAWRRPCSHKRLWCAPRNVTVPEGLGRPSPTATLGALDWRLLKWSVLHGYRPAAPHEKSHEDRNSVRVTGVHRLIVRGRPTTTSSAASGAQRSESAGAPCSATKSSEVDQHRYRQVNSYGFAFQTSGRVLPRRNGATLRRLELWTRRRDLRHYPRFQIAHIARFCNDCFENRQVAVEPVSGFALLWHPGFNPVDQTRRSDISTNAVNQRPGRHRSSRGAGANRCRSGGGCNRLCRRSSRELATARRDRQAQHDPYPNAIHRARLPNGLRFSGE